MAEVRWKLRKCGRVGGRVEISIVEISTIPSFPCFPAHYFYYKLITSLPPLPHTSVPHYYCISPLSGDHWTATPLSPTSLMHTHCTKWMPHLSHHAESQCSSHPLCITYVCAEACSVTSHLSGCHTGRSTIHWSPSSGLQ